MPTLPQRSSSQTIRRSSSPLSRNFSAVGSSAARLLVTSTRAPESRELVRQRDFAVERAEMHDPGAGLQRAEEVHRMIRRIAEEQRDRMLLAIAGAQQGRGSRLHHRLKLGIADRAVAEFDRRPVSELCGRVRQQIGQRAARDRIVPMHAFRIELLARMGHRSLPFPPPLRGRVREGGKPQAPGV